MPQAPICILSDLTIDMSLVAPHNFAPLPVGTVPPPMPAIAMSPAPASAVEPPAPMLWPPGNLLFKNKYATTVTHKMLGVIQAGHDLGVMLPHVQAVPATNNMFTPLHTLFSSRKVSFSSSSVKVHGAFVGLAGIAGSVPTPMLVCAEPLSFPMGEVPTRWLNTVWVGYSWMDFLLGVMNVAVGIFMERVGSPKGRLGPLKKVVKDQKQGARALIYKKMFPVQSMKDAKTAFKKQVVGMASGVVTSAAQGEGGTAITLGGAYVNLSLGVKASADGNWGATVKLQGPALSETATVQQSDGFSAQGQANWGTGGGSISRNRSESTIATHNTFGGTTHAESSKKP